LNERHQLVLFDDDINMVGENISAIRKNTESLSGANREFGLDINGN